MTGIKLKIDVWSGKDELESMLGSGGYLGLPKITYLQVGRLIYKPLCCRNSYRSHNLKTWKLISNYEKRIRKDVLTLYRNTT